KNHLLKRKNRKACLALISLSRRIGHAPHVKRTSGILTAYSSPCSYGAATVQLGARSPYNPPGRLHACTPARLAAGDSEGADLHAFWHRLYRKSCPARLWVKR